VPFGHIGFDERADTLSRFMEMEGWAENVYFISDSIPGLARKAADSWIHSPEHLENIRGDYNYTGVGIVKDNKGGYYFTQFFVKKD
jgi:uncharacterized protein YkwD